LTCSRTWSCAGVLLQHEQEHAGPQYLLLAKHSQYSFKHLDFLQLHGLCSPSVWTGSGFACFGFTWSILNSMVSLGGTFSFNFVFSICSRIFFAKMALFRVDACCLFWGKMPGIKPASSAACCLDTAVVLLDRHNTLIFSLASYALRSRLISRGLW